MLALAAQLHPLWRERHLDHYSGLVASNLLPATGPVSAGGYQGRDAETHRTNLATEGVTSWFSALASEDGVSLACTPRPVLSRGHSCWSPRCVDPSPAVTDAENPRKDLRLPMAAKQYAMAAAGLARQSDDAELAVLMARGAPNPRRCT